MPGGSPGGLTPQSNNSSTGAAASATGTVTIGNASPQPLPSVAGYGGTIRFPAPVPQPSASASPAPISVAVTATAVRPSAAPELQEKTKRARKGASEQAKAVVHKPLFYVVLNAPEDVTLSAFPAFAFNVPNAQFTKATSFGLALFDPAEKVHRFKLEVAERDESTPPPVTASPSPAAVTAKSTASARPSSSPQPTGPPTATPVPTTRVSFLSGTTGLKLRANTSYVFALYSYVPTPAPSASSDAAASPASSPGSGASASPQASPAASATPKR